MTTRITIEYDDIIEAVESKIRNASGEYEPKLIQVKNIQVAFEREAIELWTDRLLLFGKEVLIKACGIAIMKRQYTATPDDIKQAFCIQKMGLDNILPTPDSEDSD